MSAAPFVAHASKGKILLILLGGVVLIAASGFILLNPGEFADYVRIFGILIPIAWIAWVGIVFFGACSLLWIRQMTRSGPVIELSSAGLRWRNWSDDLIPWSAFMRAELTQIQRQRFVSLWLRDPGAYRSTTLVGRLAGANKAMGFGDIALGSQGTDRSFDELVAAVHAHAPGLFGAG